MSRGSRRSFTLACLAVCVAVPLHAAPDVKSQVDAAYPGLETLYRELHASPELSFQETATAARMAGLLRALGFEVTTGVGRTGVVGVLRNGTGPTVLVRTDMDGLPVEEQTGLSFASKATGTAPDGSQVAVMHACGHDVHMTSWYGTASVLARNKGLWHGTLVMVAQPAEEVGEGAAGMIADGLLTRFPRPDFALAFHDMPGLPAGAVALSAGPVSASSDSIDVTIFGRGGHGAFPHLTVDPIVLAARFVLAVQTLVSRENDPFDPAVVSVGSLHAGTKHNVIPDEARLKMTVRTYQAATRERLLAGLRRMAKAEAEASSAPRPPEITVSEPLPPTVNDAALTRRLDGALRSALGDHVLPQKPMMAAEDFAYYGRAGVPAVMMWLGTSSPASLEEARRTGVEVPSLHSSRFAPDVEPTLKGGVTAMTLAVLELMR